MNCAVFLDRDGTLNKDEGFTYKVEDLKFIEGTFKGLSLIQSLDYKLIIVTNQAGIGKGKYKEEDYFLFKEEMHRKLKEQGIIITAEYFCPHHPEATIEKYRINCSCRKPEPGMLEQAAKDFNLDLKRCWMIGDCQSDVLAGKNAGCRTIQVMTGKEKIRCSEADFLTNNLLEAAKYLYSKQ